MIAAQAVHSVEEFIFRLYDLFPPAAFVSQLIAADRGTGFAIANCVLVAFGLWCWLDPIRKGRRSGLILAYGWAATETANGIAHIILAAAAGGYFPGVVTAPLLLLASGGLFLQLVRKRDPDENPAA